MPEIQPFSVSDLEKEDIRQIKGRVRELLAQEDNPAQALEAARKLALAHQGHGNVYAVVQALATPPAPRCGPGRS